MYSQQLWAYFYYTHPSIPTLPYWVYVKNPSWRQAIPLHMYAVCKSRFQAAGKKKGTDQSFEGDLELRLDVL